MSFCICCQAPLSGRQTKFCSNKCKQKYTNIKYQNYQSQKEKGFLRKIQLMESKGGKCEICGYDKNYAALCFHHINPNEKELPLTVRQISNHNIKKLQEEIKKCMLLCHNCHMELHHPSYNK